jgi:D-sedoheptulose 7-phosphate isomerase
MGANDEALRALYPFMHGHAPAAGRVQQGLLDSVHAKAADSIAVKQAFFARHSEAVIAAAETVAASFRAGGTLFSMGNGGSSCDAAHIAVEFRHPVTTGRPALRALDLGTDTAMITAVGNDVGFRHVYLRQIEAMARTGDCLVGFSTSGNSDNLLAAFAKAREMGLHTIGIAGMDGGAMARDARLEHCLVVGSDSIHRVQECHVAIYHILWDLVHTLLADSRGPAGGPP